MSVTPQAPDASNRDASDPEGVYVPQQQGTGNVPPWHQQPAHEQRNGVATAGFVVALIGAVLALIPIVGTVSWLVSPVGLILSIVGLTMAGRRGNNGRGLALTGVILGVVGLIICSIYAAAFAKGVSNTSSYTAPTVPTYSMPSYTAPSQSSSGSASQSSGGSSAAAPVPATNSFSDGTYEVGSAVGDIPPGRYKTTGANTGAAIQYCAVIREKIDGSIIDLDNSSGGPMVVTVKGSDGQVEFQGDCTWTKQ